MSAAIRFDDVSKIFATRDNAVVAIEQLSFDVAPGEFVSILGRSGCGKSTAVSLILGLIAPTTGRVEVLGVDPRAPGDGLRNRLACVFQTDRLLPWRSALANVTLPLEIAGVAAAERTERAQLWLDQFGLGDFAAALPHELSGGMRQRVAIARALVGEPEVVLADEAFASLDAITGRELRADFHRTAKAGGRTVLAITHSIDEALDLSDRIIVLGKPGRVLLELDDISSANPTRRGDFRRAITDALEQSPHLAVAAE